MNIRSILIVEDDEGTQFYLSVLLRKINPDIQVLQAFDGQQASSILNNADDLPDMVFLDINMPVMGGVEFLQQNQQTLADNSIRVIVQTSSDNEKDKRATEDFDVVSGYVLKPINADALRACLS